MRASRNGIAQRPGPVSELERALPDLIRLRAPAARAVRESPAGGLHVAANLGPGGDAPAVAVRSAFLDGLAASLIAVAVILAVAAVGAFSRAPQVLPETT
jgi:hypothetical protein